MKLGERLNFDSRLAGKIFAHSKYAQTFRNLDQEWEKSARLLKGIHELLSYDVGRLRGLADLEFLIAS